MKNEDRIVEDDNELAKGSNVTTKGMHLAIREDFDVNVDDVHKATAKTKPRTILMSQVKGKIQRIFSHIYIGYSMFSHI